MKAEWMVRKISDIAQINANSYQPKEKWSFVAYLDTGNITENAIDSIQYIDTELEKLPSRARRKVNRNSILYSTVRPNQKHFGIIRQVPEHFLVSTGFAVIDADPAQADADYLYYYLTQKKIVDYLHTIAEQSVSAYPSIKACNIGDLEISLPPIYIQSKAASLLRVLDDKIAINKEINNTLERQAAAIYNTFFSQQSCAHGKIAALGEYCSIFTGRKNANASVENGKYKFFSCAPDALRIDSYIYDGNAIIISGNGAYTGRTRFYSGKFDLYQRTYACILRESIEEDYIFPLYWFVKLGLSKKIMGGTRGSAIPYIVLRDLTDFNFIFDEQSFLLYTPVFKSLTKTIQTLEIENEKLSCLRDILLPRLITGELGVSGLDE